MYCAKGRNGPVISSKIVFYNVYAIYYLDINECLQENVCNPNANCTDSEGSYNCKCHTGFAGDGRSCVGRFTL